MPELELVKLNLGSGTTKLKGYVNIDGTESCKPDLVLDISNERLPFKEESVDEVVMFHTIEHIQKKRHVDVFLEIARVLKTNGKFILSYPEFMKCVENWKSNFKGEREFWEATIFGRQAYPGDFHVSLMDPVEVGVKLKMAGFGGINHCPEKNQPFNTITWAKKINPRFKHYEEVVLEDMGNVVLSKAN